MYQGILEDRVTPTDEELATDEALNGWLRRNTGTSHHISGTCKMGPDSDPMTVVDQYLKVKGVEGLRVADASVMPGLHPRQHQRHHNHDCREALRLHKGREVVLTGQSQYSRGAQPCAPILFDIPHLWRTGQ